MIRREASGADFVIYRIECNKMGMAIEEIPSRIAIPTTSSTAENPLCRFGVVRRRPFVPLASSEPSVRFRSTRGPFRWLLAQVLHEKLRRAIEDMNACRAVADAVATVGIDQELGIFLRLHQLLLERDRIREMHVIVASGVRDEQLALQSGREVYQRSIAIALGILLPCSHVARRIDRVVTP